MFHITTITRFELKCKGTKDTEDLYINMLRTLSLNERSADVAAYIYKEKRKVFEYERLTSDLHLHSKIT